jgi:hypothetical protein
VRAGIFFIFFTDFLLNVESLRDLTRLDGFIFFREDFLEGKRLLDEIRFFICRVFVFFKRRPTVFNLFRLRDGLLGVDEKNFVRNFKIFLKVGIIRQTTIT